MYTFERVFGPRPRHELYRDDQQLKQKVFNRYADLENDFRGVKALLTPDSNPADEMDLALLSPAQAAAIGQAHRAAVKLTTDVYLAVFAFEHYPVRAICDGIRMLGGSDGFPFREPRPWLLPVKGLQSPDAFDKTIASEVADAVRQGHAFVFLDMSLFPLEIQEQNQQNLDAAAEREPAGVEDLPDFELAA